MAVNIYWPSTLPQKPQENFSEVGGVLVLRSQTDKGPAKMRRRGKYGGTMQVSFYMTNAQYSTFKAFVEDTLFGTKRFGFNHPMTNALLEVRIVPQQDGQMYNTSYITNGWNNVSMTFEVIP
jgi:hypothetical protein